MREGTQTEEDVSFLNKCVVKKENYNFNNNHLYLAATNAEVNDYNLTRLEMLETTLYSIKTIVKYNNRISTRQPPVSADMSIRNCPLQETLHLKLGAEVVLTVNLDTKDGLCNGAMGSIVDFDFDSSTNAIMRVYVEFHNSQVGQERQKSYNLLSNRFPNRSITPIEKIEREFSISGEEYTKNAHSRAINFPLKLSWASTVHRVQGSTIKQPRKLVINTSKVFEGGMCYVMMSRVQTIDQLIIIDAVNDSKIYPSTKAIQELEKMNGKVKETINTNKIQTVLSVATMNIRTIRKHFIDLIDEPNITKNDIICLQEQCLL